MTSDRSTADRIKSYIQTSFSSPEDALELGVDDDLLDVLDSLQVLRMIMDLEVEYQIKFDNSEMTPENLGSVQRLAAFVDAKR